MKNLISILSALMITACGAPMNNQQIIQEVELCKEAGLEVVVRKNEAGYIHGIICTPRETVCSVENVE